MVGLEKEVLSNLVISDIIIQATKRQGSPARSSRPDPTAAEPWDWLCRNSKGQMRQILFIKESALHHGTKDHFILFFVVSEYNLMSLFC